MNDLSYGQLMTGATIQGVQDTKGVNPNINVEDGEYVKFPDGSVAKALGESHKKGGIDLIVPSMTEILSNTEDLTIDKAMVKRLKKEYGLDNVSVNDTYSKVLDKYSRKIGYTKLIKEEEDLFNKVKENTENALSDGSRNINNDFLAKKIYKIQESKVPLQSEMEGMFNTLFSKQQESKPVDEQNVQMISDDLSEQQIFQLGGRYEEFESMRTKYNMAPQKLFKILNDNGAIPQYENGGVVVPWDDFQNIQKNYQNIPNYNFGSPQQRERLQRIINNSGAGNQLTGLGYETQSEQDASAGAYQNWLYSNMPEIAADYSSTTAPTKQGLEFVLNKNILSKEDFEKIGVRIPTKSGEVLGLQGKISEDKVKEVNELIQSKLGDSEELRNEYLRANFVDNKWFFRAPEISRVKFSSEAEKEEKLKDYTKLGDNVYKSNKTGLYFIPEVEKVKTPSEEAKLKPKVEAEQEQFNSPSIIDDIDNTQATRRNRMFQMPNIPLLPPQALQAESMYLTELGRLDPVRLGIEDTIRRNQDNTQFIASQLKSLPPTVAAGIMGSTIAQAQQSENQAINQIHAINAQNISQAEQFNIRQADLEETSNNASRLDYERRALLGLSKTDQDLRNFYNANRTIALNNFREQQIMNTMANLFPQYTIDGSGTSVVFDPQNKTYYKPMAKKI